MQNVKQTYLLTSIEQLMDEDDWNLGFTCGCENDMFHVLRRFNELKLVCSECGSDILVPIKLSTVHL